ncbi:MAG: winged helix-turn-helix domain-containing protein [Steroidobacteraceae bacterium]
MSASVFAFGGFRLDASRRLLFSAGGVVVPLNSRAFDTLAYFVQHPHQLLEKQTLLSVIWPNTIVEDNNLNQCIGALRRALGEAPGDHRFIVTVPGRGYRFVANVQDVDAEPEAEPEASIAPLETAPIEPALELTAPPPASPSIWHRRALGIVGLLLLATIVGLTAGRSGSRESRSLLSAARVELPSIAVLPLTDLSPTQDQGAFADGLSEELLAQLDQQTGVTTIGRGSSFAFKGRSEDLRRVGRQLGADYVLEGSVRHSAERIRVTLHLVETVRGTRVWSDTLERNVTDSLKVQEEIARAVVPAVARRVQPGSSGEELAQAR